MQCSNFIVVRAARGWQCFNYSPMMVSSVYVNIPNDHHSFASLKDTLGNYDRAIAQSTLKNWIWQTRCSFSFPAESHLLLLSSFCIREIITVFLNYTKTFLSFPTNLTVKSSAESLRSEKKGWECNWTWNLCSKAITMLIEAIKIITTSNVQHKIAFFLQKQKTFKFQNRI